MIKREIKEREREVEGTQDTENWRWRDRVIKKERYKKETEKETDQQE